MNGVFYCRRHEHEHLRITPQAQALNSERLGHSLTTDANGCWLWGEAVNDGGYGVFVPEGANIAKWYAHRVAWGLLVGGHKPGLELDHRTCKRRRCVNPLHLEPVTKSTNQRRKRSGPEWAWINTNAASHPSIHEFAARHGLPVPDHGAPTTTRKTTCSTSPRLYVRRDGLKPSGAVTSHAASVAAVRHRQPTAINTVSRASIRPVRRVSPSWTNSPSLPLAAGESTLGTFSGDSRRAGAGFGLSAP
jgi:hypothetical protein